MCGWHVYCLQSPPSKQHEGAELNEPAEPDRPPGQEAERVLDREDIPFDAESDGERQSLQQVYDVLGYHKLLHSVGSAAVLDHGVGQCGDHDRPGDPIPPHESAGELDALISMTSVVISSRSGVESYIVSSMMTLASKVENIHQGTRNLLHIEGERSSRHLLLVFR